MSSYFNPRSPHGERRVCACAHARGGDFNPRSPHGERRSSVLPFFSPLLFQPTLPARGATTRLTRARWHGPISTHAPRTGSDQARYPYQRQGQISTHAPRTGSDNLTAPADDSASISTHAPRTGSDIQLAQTLLSTFQISTHAPRTGSDASQPRDSQSYHNFNPRSPHGERLHSTRTPPRGGHFNPRSPHGERPTELPA